MKKILITFLLFVLISSIFAQDPPDIKWKEINTKNYHIIFPHEIYSEANRVANTLEYLYPFTSKTLGGKHNRIPLLLSNRSTESNGYVQLAPWKSEWYNVPEGNKILGQGEWYNTLAIHETRHMVQFSYLNRNMSKLFYILGGSLWQFGFSIFCVPDWFWEGDAVCSETVLTNFGRGRLPYFDKGIRAILNNNISYSYAQSRFGSYKNYIPGHYEYGYFLSTHVKRKYDVNAWPEILNNATKISLLHPLNSFSEGLGKSIGKNVSQIYDDTMSDLKILWKEQQDNLNITPGKIISPNSNNFTKYEQPYVNNHNEIYCVKSGFADAPQIVKLTKKGEEKIIQVSYDSKHSGVSFNEDKSVWCEVEQDKRWTKQSWSNIIIYDIETNKSSKLTDKVRYFYPSISKSGKIAAIEFTKTRKCNFIIIDSENGKILASIPSPENDMIQYSSWSEDEKYIVFTSNGFNGKAMYILDWKKEKFNKLIDCSNEEIFRPVFWNDYIFYESAYSGIDNINAININNGKRFQIVCRDIGSYNPVISSDKQYIVFSEYNHNGYRLVKIKIDQSKWIPIKEVRINKVEYFRPVVEQEQGDNILIRENISDIKYKMENYSGFGKYFNFHSWDIIPYENDIEINLYSNNILQTVGLTLGSVYNYNEKANQISATFNYLGLYPKLYGQVSFENRMNQDSVIIMNSGKPNGLEKDSWNETNFTLFADLPLYRSRKGPNVSVINFQNGFGVKKINNFEKNIKWNNQKVKINEDVNNTFSVPVYFVLNYQKYCESALKDLVTPYQYVEFSTSFTTLNKNNRGSQFAGKFVKAFKPPFRHHGFIFNLDYEKNFKDGYSFSSRINTPDGYSHHIHEHQFKFKSQYKFPIFYPDLNILGITYFKRFYASLYTDWMRGWGDFEKDYLTIGCAWTFEFGGILDVRFILPVSLLTYYNPNEKKYGIKFSLFY